MSDGTVQRFNFGLCDEGCEVDCAHDEFVLASDFDALRTQARELAEAAKLFAEGWTYAGKQKLESLELIRQAQAVLKEGA